MSRSLQFCQSVSSPIANKPTRSLNSRFGVFSAFLSVCLNAKHRMGCPKRDGMNKRRSYWMRWSMRQLQPGLDIGAEAEPVVKRGSEVA